MVKVAVTGPDGLIGSRIFELLRNDFEFISLKQSEFDITNREALQKNLNDIDFDILLHMAAYTNVDGAEQQKKLAYKVNVEGTKNVFEIALKKNKKFIYISTDFVFDGMNLPYFEDSIPHPLSYYAQTKYEGELIVKDSAMIVRLAYPYRAAFDIKKDFVRSIISTLLEQNKPVTMVADSLMTPTFIDDMAYSFKYLFVNFKPDIYHIVGSDSLSPYNAGKLIAKTFNLDASLIQPTNFQQYSKNKAPRPQYSQIKSKKNNFYKMKTFEEGLNEIKLQITKSK